MIKQLITHQYNQVDTPHRQKNIIKQNIIPFQNHLNNRFQPNLQSKTSILNLKNGQYDQIQENMVNAKDKGNEKIFLQKCDLHSAINLIIQSTHQHIPSSQYLNPDELSQIRSNLQNIQKQLLSQKLQSFSQKLLFSQSQQYNPQSCQIKHPNVAQDEEQNQFQTLQLTQNIPSFQMSQNLHHDSFQTLSKLQTIIDKLIIVHSLSFSTKIAPLLHIKQLQKISKKQTKPQQKYQNKKQLTKQKQIKQKQLDEIQQIKNNQSQIKNQINFTQSSSKFQQLDFEQQKSIKQIQKIQENQLSFQDLNEQLRQQIIDKQQQNQQLVKEKIEQKEINENIRENIILRQTEFIQVVPLIEEKTLNKENKIKQQTLSKEMNQTLTKEMNEIIEQNIKYLIHFSQINTELALDLSSNKTQSLSYTYNLVRFLITNFLFHFRNQIILKIKQQIKSTFNNQVLYNEFNTRLQNNLRYQDCQNKFQQVRSQCWKRFLNYQQKIQNSSQTQLNQLKSTNVAKLYQLMKQKPKLISLFKQLNTNPLKQYNFEKVKQIYASMINLAKQEFLNQRYLQKSFRRIARSLNIKGVDINSFLTQINRYLLGENKRKILFEKILILLMQQLKVCDILLSLPYYSFLNEMENEQRKITKQKDFDKKLRDLLRNYKKIQMFQTQNLSSQKGRKQELTQLLLKNLDGLYIMKCKRVNRQNWQGKLKLDQFQFYDDVQYYLDLHNVLLDFINGKEQNKQKQKQDLMYRYSAISKYHQNKIQPIQYGRYSIFHHEEQSQINQIIKNTLTNKTQDQNQKSPFSLDIVAITKFKKTIKSLWNFQQI